MNTPFTLPALDNEDLPLKGLLVLDFAQFLAAPSSALRLADLGADVIKIERPQGGDLSRGLAFANLMVDGSSGVFHAINRNKRSFAADLKDPGDLAAVKALIGKADVMIQNFRPGVMERIGLGYDAVRELNPRLVYASVSGYGDQGAWKDKPGQDLLVQSLSGLAWLNGDRDQAPTPVGIAVADLITGAHLVQGILAALVRRAVSGRGARVDVSLLESILDIQFEQFTTFLNSKGQLPERAQVRNASVYLAAPYGIYSTSDGFIAVAMNPIGRLATLLECPGLAPFAEPSTWFDQRDEIKRILGEHLGQQSSAHWLAILEKADVWCADVLDWNRLMAHEAFASLDMVNALSTRHGTPFMTTRCPIRIDGRILRSARPAPEIGQHNAEIQSLLDGGEITR